MKWIIKFLIAGILIYIFIFFSYAWIRKNATKNNNDFKNYANNNFLEMTKEAQVNFIKTKNYNDQIKIYLYASENSHYIAWNLANALAIHGKTIVPHLLAEIKNTDPENEFRKISLLIVFNEMKASKYYDIKNDKNTLLFLINQSNEISNTNFKEIYINLIHQLLK